MRAFISVELPEGIKKKIFKATAEMRAIESGVKWVEEQNLHLTLKFLGSIEGRDLLKAVSLAEEAAKGFNGFKIRFEGLGSFPEDSPPRILWVGISEGGENLKRIAESLGNREFSAHLTIGRVKDKGVDEVKSKMAGIHGFSFGEMAVDSINIMKSTLTQKGPVYENYRRIVLGR